MKRTRTLTRLVLAGCIAIATAALAQPAVELALPSGRYAVGRVGYHWTDPTRSDRVAAVPRAPRELMVYVWYPVSARAAQTRGTYLPGARDMDALPHVRSRMAEEFGTHWPSVVSGAVASHALEGAKPAEAPAKFPVVTFSHGNGSTTFAYTSLIEDLVSHGYVVAAVEHTHTSVAVRFPDARVVPFQEPKRPAGLSRSEVFEWMSKSAAVGIEEGAADIGFVLRQLGQSPLAGRLDLKRVAAMGHSAGGAFAARACQLDSGIKACVDLDGGMVPVAALPTSSDGATIRQPLLFMEAQSPEARMFGTKEELQRYSETKEQQLRSCAPGTFNVILTAPGIAHPSFSDIPLFFAGTEGYPKTNVIRRNHRLIHAFVREFLGKSLRNEKAPLFDDSSRTHPNATVRRYGR